MGTGGGNPCGVMLDKLILLSRDFKMPKWSEGKDRTETRKKVNSPQGLKDRQQASSVRKVLVYKGLN